MLGNNFPISCVESLFKKWYDGCLCVLAMDLWTSVVPHIFFELVEMHYSDCVMQQFDFKQHIPSDTDTSD
jgi:hypothetical protein